MLLSKGLGWSDMKRYTQKSRLFRGGFGWGLTKYIPEVPFGRRRFRLLTRLP